MITGRLACASTAAAASTAARSPRSRGAMRVGAIRSSSASDLRMSPGSDRNTGPVGGASAVLAARCTSRGRSATRPTSSAHLTNGRASRGRSAERIGSVTMNSWSCWPAVTRIGEAAFWASYSMPMALPSPGATWKFATVSLPDACA